VRVKEMVEEGMTDESQRRANIIGASESKAIEDYERLESKSVRVIVVECFVLDSMC
jgi:hypothetical protein